MYFADGEVDSLVLTNMLFQTKQKGLLPSSIFMLGGLERLEIDGAGRMLTFANFSSFERLSKLHWLQLDGIGVPPYLPDSLCACVSLASLDFSNQKLRGHLPSCLERMSKLEELLLANNNLEGSVDSLPWKSLRILDLSYNNLAGPLPRIDNAPRLEKVNIEGNEFTSIGSLAHCPALRLFMAKKNKISTSLKDILPDTAATEMQLEHLDLGTNLVHGTIPENLLDKAPRLFSLKLGHNQMTGTIPERVVCGTTSACCKCTMAKCQNDPVCQVCVVEGKCRDKGECTDDDTCAKALLEGHIRVSRVWRA